MRLAGLFPVAVVLAATSCAAGQGSAADDRAIAIYSAVIRAVSTKPTSTPPTTAPRGPVFVAAAQPRSPIPLEVQAGVVDELHRFATIRFVDKRSEAIAAGAPHKPVHDDGVLITLGEIPRGPTDVTIEAERYERNDARATYEVSLHRTGAHWKVVRASSEDEG
jgi:DNA-directed RNA polymerase subunit K/omega